MFVHEDIKYTQYIKENYFYICNNKQVIEFGTNIGHHTKLLLEMGARQITCVEPNKYDLEFEIYNHPSIVKYNGTLNDYYNYTKTLTTKSTVDVVVCMGLLYHLHSPLYALEQIINYSRPKYLIIESILTEPTYTQIHYEPYDTNGHAFSDKGVSYPIGVNLRISFDAINSAILTTNYKLIKKSEHPNEFFTPSKLSICLAMYESIDDE